MKIFNLIITTPKKVMEAAKEVYGEGMKAGAKIEKQTTKAYINPVIHDLEKLRANTWDQDKITFIQNWIRNGFENQVDTAEYWEIKK